MTWADDEIAEPMGYEICVLFDCARNALAAYHDITEKPLGLPENICPELVSHMRERGHEVILGQVNPLTGLAKGAVHLYGYQASQKDADLSLDPLMTGWVRRLQTGAAIISFGRKKMLSLGYGGAFLTNNAGLAEEMTDWANWNVDYTDLLIDSLPQLKEYRLQRFEVIEHWDRYLADSLIRFPGEQLMPWRVMRRATDKAKRDSIVKTLRFLGYDVGTNYPPLQGSNTFGDTVLNFSVNIEKEEVKRACEIIKRITDG